VNALPSPEHHKEVVLAPIHSSAGTLCTRVGYWRRRPPGDLAVFSTFARLRPSSNVQGRSEQSSLAQSPVPSNRGGLRPGV
jgi:hypothetical protein